MVKGKFYSSEGLGIIRSINCLLYAGKVIQKNQLEATITDL